MKNRNMGTQEIKAQIEKILAEIPEENLKDVLQYLKQVKASNSEEVGRSVHLRKIFEEDKNLLKRLAK